MNKTLREVTRESSERDSIRYQGPEEEKLRMELEENQRRLIELYRIEKKLERIHIRYVSRLGFGLFWFCMGALIDPLLYVFLGVGLAFVLEGLFIQYKYSEVEGDLIERSSRLRSLLEKGGKR